MLKQHNQGTLPANTTFIKEVGVGKACLKLTAEIISKQLSYVIERHLEHFLSTLYQRYQCHCFIANFHNSSLGTEKL